jgi:predicted transcriptional regulator
MAATTILTLLSRLVEREFITIEKIGRSNYYTPVISRQDYIAAQSRSFLDKLCGGDIRAFATALCDSGLSRSDIEELRRLLEKGEL